MGCCSEGTLGHTVLFGGGFALAGGFGASGLSDLTGQFFEGISIALRSF